MQHDVRWKRTAKRLCNKCDRAITCMFCPALHLTLLCSCFIQKFCVKEGEVWWKFILFFKHNYCRTRFCCILSSAILLCKFTITGLVPLHQFAHKLWHFQGCLWVFCPLTALHWAVMSNNHNVIRALLRAGASMDALNAEVWNLFTLLSLLSVYQSKCSKSVGHVFCHKKRKRGLFYFLTKITVLE